MRKPSDAFRPVLLPLGLLCGLVGLILWFCLSRSYFVMDYLDKVSAVWHDDEAFIFVGRGTAGKSPLTWRAVLEGIGFAWNAPETLQSSLVVFHIRGELLEKYELQNFDQWGGGFPYQGQLYFYRGGEAQDWPYIWKWVGTNFIRLQKNDALEILKQFQYFSDQFKKEGWKEESRVVFNDRDMRYNISLTNHPLILVTRCAQSGSQKVILEGRLASKTHETLAYADKGYYHLVNKKRYLQQKENIH